jgi:RNA-directed DNA polymerase
MSAKAPMRGHLIGAAPAAERPREGGDASFATGTPAARCVSAQPNASNAWNQNWNTSNPGNQNNNNKTNANRVRAVRRPRLAGMDDQPTAEELFQAYYDCRATKRNTWSALKFEERLERNLMQLLHDLRDGAYQIGPSECLVVQHPKVREVWAADFRDRVVHHLLYNRIAPYFHARFISDTYACIPGRGTLKAVDRLAHFMRSASQDHSQPAWALQCDIANFFVSIQKPLLDDMLATHLGDASWTMGLARIILHNDPTARAQIKSPPTLLRQVPRHKSLFCSGGLGLPIGNLSSQFFANVYLDGLDQFIKRQPWGRRYVRYVDDMTVVATAPDGLHQASQQIDEHLQRLGCRLHPRKTRIAPLRHGLQALGFVLRPWARYIKRHTLHHAHQAIDGMCRAQARPAVVQATANSYFGLMQHADAFRAREQFANLLRRHGHLVSIHNNRMLLTP